MLKVKQIRTADCVVGGFRYATGSREVGSLLLGLYDKEGKLDHVGFTSTITNEERPAITKVLEATDRAARLHRQGAGRSEPLEYRALRRMGTVETQDRGRGALRPGDRRPLPARHEARPLPPRQGAAAMHLRADRAGGDAGEFQAPPHAVTRRESRREGARTAAARCRAKAGTRDYPALM